MILAAGLALVAMAVIVQMFRIQSSEQAKVFLSQGDRYSGEFRMFYPERGEIYDRLGHLLAGNRTVYEVGVSLNEMRSPESLAHTLSTYLGLSYEEIYDKLTNSPEAWEYIVVQDFVGAETVTLLQELMQDLEEIGRAHV